MDERWPGTDAALDWADTLWPCMLSVLLGTRKLLSHWICRCTRSQETGRVECECTMVLFNNTQVALLEGQGRPRQRERLNQE